MKIYNFLQRMNIYLHLFVQFWKVRSHDTHIDNCLISIVELVLGVNFQSPVCINTETGACSRQRGSHESQERISQQPRYAVNMSDVSVCLAGPLFKSKSGNLYDQAQCYGVGLIDAFHSISVLLQYLRTGQA